MTICSADLCWPASPRIRRLLLDLARRGVVSANGRVIASAAEMGEPPAGHDHVMIRNVAGFPAVDDAESLGIQATMAAEALAILRNLMPEEAESAAVVECSYFLHVAEETASLSITTLGLVDHERHVVLS